MPNADVERVLARGVERGVISPTQLQQLREIATDGETRGGALSRFRRGFTGVRLAYSIGALLVVFASGWFLFDRWEKLGPSGVLIFVSVYAMALGTASIWLRRRDFDEAADLTMMLLVSLTPLATWPLLKLAGLWAEPRQGYWYLSDVRWIEWNWIVVELATILVALLVLRWRLIVAVTYPIGVALLGLQYHLAHNITFWWPRAAYERWIHMACALATVAIAESIDRWQRRRDQTSDALDDDFANAIWLSGVGAFVVSYADLWDGAGRWRHFLPVISLGFAWVALVLRRRILVLVAMGGVFVYLAWLTDSVFHDVVSFPIVLAVIGLLMIIATVWAQRRFPQLSARADDGVDGMRRGLPWSPVMPWVAPAFALAMALIHLAGAEEERAQFAFNARFEILRAHSHRYLRYRERHESGQERNQREAEERAKLRSGEGATGSSAPARGDSVRRPPE